KSVFEVKVISQETIKLLAGNTLADVLNQSLNINIQPNPSSGKSNVKLFGLDGQYFKILVDNIPLINDEGLGNNTDPMRFPASLISLPKKIPTINGRLPPTCKKRPLARNMASL